MKHSILNVSAPSPMRALVTLIKSRKAARKSPLPEISKHASAAPVSHPAIDNDMQRLDLSAIPRRFRKRTQLVAEIVSTEKSYLSYLYVAESSLHTLVNESIRELDLSLHQYISLRHLVSSLAQLRNASKTTMLAMMKRLVGDDVKDWRDERSAVNVRYWIPSSAAFGDVMLSVLPSIVPIYTDYVMKFQEYIANITDAMASSPRFKCMIEKIQRLPEMNNLTMNAVLLMPVQRIPRYRLLLQNLLAATASSHPDASTIQKAFDQYESFAKEINEKLRQQENTRAIKSIEDKMSNRPTLNIPGRELLLQGRLIKACRLGNEPKQFYIFNDVLMYANIIDQRTLVFRNAFPLDDLKVVDIPASDSPMTLGLGLFVLFDKTTPYSFLILSPKRSFQVFCKTQHEKEAWMEKLKGAIVARKRTIMETQQSELITVDFSTTQPEEEDHEKSYQLAPIWVPDFASSSCMICDTQFTMINRRHHCRLCGKICCNACSSKKTSVRRSNMHVQEERVCDPCYEDIHETMTISVVDGKHDGKSIPLLFKNFFSLIKV